MNVTCHWYFELSLIQIRVQVRRINHSTERRTFLYREVVDRLRESQRMYFWCGSRWERLRYWMVSPRFSCIRLVIDKLSSLHNKYLWNCRGLRAPTNKMVQLGISYRCVTYDKEPTENSMFGMRFRGYYSEVTGKSAYIDSLDTIWNSAYQHQRYDKATKSW